MTPPPASTTAGRQASRPGKASTGHRRSLRKQVAPPRPRRVSGPARSRVGPSVSRRVALPARAAAFVRTLAEHSFLDRIVRGVEEPAIAQVIEHAVVRIVGQIVRDNRRLARCSPYVHRALQAHLRLVRQQLVHRGKPTDG